MRCMKSVKDNSKVAFKFKLTSLQISPINEETQWNGSVFLAKWTQISTDEE